MMQDARNTLREFAGAGGLIICSKKNISVDLIDIPVRVDLNIQQRVQTLWSLRVVRVLRTGKAEEQAHF